MELPVQIPQSVLATAKSKLLPWALLIVLLLIVISGLVGLYFGYHYAKGEYSADKAAMLTAYNTALEESQARRKEQEDKGNLIAKDFMGKLAGIKVVNNNYHTTLQKETEKLVYTDCKVPDSGIDLLNKHIEESNMVLLGKGVAK